MVTDREREGQEWREKEKHRQGVRKGGKEKERGRGEKERGAYCMSIYSNAILCNSFNNFPTQEIRNVVTGFLT